MHDEAPLLDAGPPHHQQINQCRASECHIEPLLIGDNPPRIVVSEKKEFVAHRQRPHDRRRYRPITDGRDPPFAHADQVWWPNRPGGWEPRTNFVSLMMRCCVTPPEGGAVRHEH